MGYKEFRVGIEYDGPQHWTDPEVRDRDIDKSCAFSDLGWTVIRVGSNLLRDREGTFVARVFDAMLAAGWRPGPPSVKPTTAKRAVAKSVVRQAIGFGWCVVGMSCVGWGRRSTKIGWWRRDIGR
jgi:hypothetical protein